MKANSILKNIIINTALGTALILLIPLVAMQFTEEVNWTLADFIVMGALLFVIGLLLNLAMKVRNKTHRLVFGAMIIIGFLYIWAEMAVGVFTNLGS